MASLRSDGGKDKFSPVVAETQVRPAMPMQELLRVGGAQSVFGMGWGSGARTSGPWPSSETARNADAQAPFSKNPEIGGSPKVQRPEGCTGIQLVKGRRKIVPEK